MVERITVDGARETTHSENLYICMHIHAYGECNGQFMQTKNICLSVILIFNSFLKNDFFIYFAQTVKCTRCAVLVVFIYNTT